MPKSKPKQDEPPTKGKCYQCGKECGEDQYCSGCREFICEECDVNYNAPWGMHQPSVHFEEPDDYDD